MKYADTVENAQWFSDARDVALRACTKYQKKLKTKPKKCTLKRELVHFRAKAKRLDRENVNHRVDLRMYRKQCLDYDNAIVAKVGQTWLWPQLAN